MQLLQPEECPIDAFDVTVYWNCKGAPFGSLCEGDGHSCGTRDDANNCMVRALPLEINTHFLQG